MKNSILFRRSVSRKYSLGYIILSVIAVILIGVSFFSSSFISKWYQSNTNELLSLNQLYIDIESVNSCVNNGYLYLRSTSYENYIEESKKVNISINKMETNVHNNYSREVIDTINTAKTYIEQTNVLMEMLKEYIGNDDKNNVDYQRIKQAYDETQETLGYINLSFQSAYSIKLISVQETQKKIENLQNRVIIYQVIFVFLGCTLCIWYSIKIIKGITHSLKVLTNAVQKIEQDVFQENYVELNSKDEFEEFASALNHMLDVIQTQLRTIEENANIKEQLAVAEIENLRIYSELQKSQLTLLQSRINPHFLFNTLNMISSMARIEEADRSAELMEITATYLRYNLDNLSRTVTLLQEIDNLKNYVKIQQYRFENRYTYYFEIEKFCENFPMPYMILQPLVENSIKHGVAMMKNNGVITTRVYSKGNRIVLEVEDNGVGMTAEKIALIYQSINAKGTQNEQIGLKNIYMRLMYFYEDDVLFKIESDKSKTIIRISLPNDRGNEYVYNGDCR